MMPFSGKRKFPYKLTIYVPREKEKIVKGFLEAYKARNESGSSKILEFIEQQMKDGKINPQTRLTEAPVKPPMCRVGRCGNFAEYVYYPPQETKFYTCRFHRPSKAKLQSGTGCKKL